jgi:hypothetical protein
MRQPCRQDVDTPRRRLFRRDFCVFRCGEPVAMSAAPCNENNPKLPETIVEINDLWLFSWLAGRSCLLRRGGVQRRPARGGLVGRSGRPFCQNRGIGVSTSRLPLTLSQYVKKQIAPKRLNTGHYTMKRWDCKCEGERQKSNSRWGEAPAEP